MRRFSILALLLAAVLGAQNIVPNADMKALAAPGKPKSWAQFQKGNLQIPGADGADFTLSQPDGKDATITVGITPEMNVPYVFKFEAKSSDRSMMNCYFEWFKTVNGKVIYGGGATTKKQIAPKSWTPFMASFILPANFHHGYVAMRSLNGKPLDVRKLVVRKAKLQADAATGGTWNLDMLGKNFTAKGVIARNDSSATLYSLPVEPGKTYMFSYDACGEGPIDPAYPFHEIRTKFVPGMQARILTNDVANSPQRKYQKFKVPEQGDICRVSIEFSCVTRSKAAYVLFSNMKLEEIVPDPREDWRFQMVKPFYRDTIFASRPLDAMECQLLTDGNAAACVVEFNGQTYRQPVNGARDVRVKIPVAGLADGSWPLVCKVCDGAGNVLKSFEKKILKVPPAPVEVVIHEDRHVYINGKPFIMNNMNLRDWSEDYMYYAARHGVNCAGLNLCHDEEENLKKLDLAQKYGIKALVYTGYADGKGMTAEKFRKKLEKMFTPAVRRHPAFLMYIVADEPFWGGKPYDIFQMTHEIYREFDPYHPTWINAAPRGEVTDLRPYADACDVYGCDIYPVPAPNSHSGLDDQMMTSVGKYSRRMNDVTFWRKPCFMCLQGFGWGENPECGPLGRAKIHPTQAEMRFMLFDAMNNGATDVEQWGSQFVKDEKFLEVVFDTCADLHRFSGLWGRGRQLANAATTNAGVAAYVWEHQGNLTYFIMNVTDKAASAVVDVSGKPLAEIMSWGCEAKAAGAGKLSVTLKPYAWLVTGTAALPEPLNPLTGRNDVFEKQGSPVAGAIRKALQAYENKKKFKTTANWIWQGAEAMTSGNVCFVGKQFKVSGGEKIQLQLAVDDSSVVYLNGKEIGKTTGWSTLYTFDLTDKVRKGDNLLMVRALDAGGLPCGVLAELKVGKSVFRTDGTWLGKPVQDAKAPVPATLDGFQPVVVVQPYGGGAWRDNVMMDAK